MQVEIKIQKELELAIIEEVELDKKKDRLIWLKTYMEVEEWRSLCHMEESFNL